MFASSGEFAEVTSLLGSHLPGATVLDLGAGNGIGAFALARGGAGTVIAIDPDPGDDVGLGALRVATSGERVEPVCGMGENLPLASESLDVVYVRQVLHHASDLRRMVSECARVLRPGGVFLASREHVVDDERQLREFLDAHPVHRLAGGENAFALQEYLAAISGCGLVIAKVLGPVDCLMNAFPEVRTREQLSLLPWERFRGKLGPLARVLWPIPGVSGLTRKQLNARGAGRLYSFLALKPA